MGGGLQVMCMVGIKPVSDALGRVNKLEVISLEDLGRPRIDVVVNCSGVFRDLFVNQVRGGNLGIQRTSLVVCWTVINLTFCIALPCSSPLLQPLAPVHPDFLFNFVTLLSHFANVVELDCCADEPVGSCCQDGSRAR